MKKISTILLGSLLILSSVLTSCEAIKNTSNSQRGVAIGAVGGAVLGGILGNKILKKKT